MTSEFRLVGIGKFTEGVQRILKPGDQVEIGRGADCDIVIQGSPEATFVSKVHAFVECTPSGWVIRDNGSANGTVVLPGGRPPARKLKPHVEMPLAAGDIIEFAGNETFNFEFRSRAGKSTQPAEGRTLPLMASDRRCVQWFLGAVAQTVLELGDGPIRIGKGREHDASWIEIRSLEHDGTAAEITIEKTHAVLRAFRTGFRVNYKNEVNANQEVVLHDGDLITTDEESSVCFLFLDPGNLRPRNLSDLMLGSARISFGRSKENSCRLQHPSVSRRHAEIWKDGSDLFIRDLHSTDGTTVNSRRVADTTKLSPGTRFSLGRVPFIADAACWDKPQTKPQSVDVRFLNACISFGGKQVVHKVSLAAGHGEMVAVLGPSGSGKSTLLKALAGQFPLSSGEILVNGRALQDKADSWNWFTSLIGFNNKDYPVGYVRQDDVVQTDLTVREILEYAARNMGLGRAEAQREAKQAAARCNLASVFDRVVHSGNKQQISGGQLKRLCVAIEVLRNPRILVLDEPLTGQDPHSGTELMQLFRALAQGGVTVLMVTHEFPTAVQFCDKIAVLSLGYLLFYGPSRDFGGHFQTEDPSVFYKTLPSDASQHEQVAHAKKMSQEFEATSLYNQYCQMED